MEIKNCAHCGGEAMIWHRDREKYAFLVRCTVCEIRTDNYQDKASAIDAWNGRFEQNPSEADRWLKEAIEQRARADRLEAERDEMAEYVEAIKRSLVYAGISQ